MWAARRIAFAYGHDKGVYVASFFIIVLPNSNDIFGAKLIVEELGGTPWKLRFSQGIIGVRRKPDNGFKSMNSPGAGSFGTCFFDPFHHGREGVISIQSQDSDAIFDIGMRANGWNASVVMSTDDQ